MTGAFHLNNREAKRELKVYNNNRFLPFCPTLFYFGVRLDKSLTFRYYLMALRKKLSLRVTLQDRDDLLVPKHYAQQPYLWSTQQLSTARQFGVAALAHTS